MRIRLRQKRLQRFGQLLVVVIERRDDGDERPRTDRRRIVRHARLAHISRASVRGEYRTDGGIKQP